ncbi:probable G-protein coupled receptor 139 [Rhincodon typus]|uniref:probable G-protein coupled receptor 139 n=1 Tax=Rhincodon typus TaxID=259920 RepID=UPI0020305360|nr:probable G-protein coupled receptor 139 [Rhincodon typus]
MTIIILSRGKCALSDSTSAYMVAMATTPLLMMIFNVHHIFSFHFIHPFFSLTGFCKFVIYMSSSNLYMAVWYTVLFTFDRYVAICCEKLKTKYCRRRKAAIAIMSTTVVVYLANLPYWIAYEPEQIIDQLQWGCRLNLNFFSSPAGEAFSWLQSILTVCLPFSLIFMFNSLTVRRIVVANRARKSIRGCKNESQRDPELEVRRKSIILLFAVSGSFILLWLTAAVSFLSTKITDTARYHGDHANPAYIATETGHMLMYLNSCTNVCIYAATQSKFRQELKKVLIFPWLFILKLTKRN